MLRRIKLRFGQLGMPKNELARRIGAAPPTVYEWWTRGALPDGEKLARLPAALGVNGHWLLTGDGPILPPGSGAETTDQSFRLGAQAVTADLRRLVADLETRYADGARSRRLPDPTPVVDDVPLEDQRAARTPGRRKQARKRRTG